MDKLWKTNVWERSSGLNETRIWEGPPAEGAGPEGMGGRMLCKTTYGKKAAHTPMEKGMESMKLSIVFSIGD